MVGVTSRQPYPLSAPSEFLELYCEALTEDEEVDIDNEVLQMVIDVLPEKLGVTYKVFCAEIEAVREPDDIELPEWFWASGFNDSKAAKTLEKHPELKKDVFRFSTYIFGDCLLEVCDKRNLLLVTIFPAPYVVNTFTGTGRLFRLKNPFSTLNRALLEYALEKVEADTWSIGDQPVVVEAHTSGPPEPSEINRELHLTQQLKLHTTLGASELMSHQYRFIAGRKEIFAESLHVRKNGRREPVFARSRLHLPNGIERPADDELLKTMHITLLKHKEKAASLLKTHLYLVDRAYNTGGDSPTFVVDMNELLEAKGYKRRADGGFQTSTYREEWGRIATLAGCWIELRRTTQKNGRGKEEIFIDETPYWEVRARRRLADGEVSGLQNVLLANPKAPVIKQIVIQPGLWWSVSNRGEMYFRLPYGLLALPTDGKGVVAPSRMLS